MTDLVITGEPPEEQGDMGRDELNQLVGQIQMANSFAKIADVVSLQRLAHIKKTKAYRQLTGVEYKNSDGKVLTVGTWSDFCRALGMSAAKVDEDLMNLNTFGEAALDGLSRIGAGYRELRQYRKLPEDDRQALIEAAKDGDKDKLIDFAESIIIKHDKEKEALKKEILEKDGRLDDMTNADSRTIKILKSDIEHKDSIIANFSSTKAYTFLPETHITREECLAHQAEIELAFNSLRQLFEGCVNDDNNTERDLRIEQVWVTIHVAAARAMDALAFLRAYNLEGMPETIAIPHRLTDDEALRWIDDYETIERKHIKDQVRRQEKRDADKPKGPGRPAKGK